MAASTIQGNLSPIQGNLSPIQGNLSAPKPRSYDGYTVIGTARKLPEELPRRLQEFLTSRLEPVLFKGAKHCKRGGFTNAKKLAEDPQLLRGFLEHVNVFSVGRKRLIKYQEVKASAGKRPVVFPVTFVLARFNQETAALNAKWRLKNGWPGCIYCMPVANKAIPAQTHMLVIEMNNSSNTIIGVGYADAQLQIPETVYGSDENTALKAAQGAL